ncbi:MAG: OsmC family peroxiredoxin [Bacteroidota bacterium]
MKIVRGASANWKGAGKTGVGKISTQSTTLDNAQLSFNTRFADGVGTNPEELVGAALAGCITMKMSFVLNAAGFTADNIDTTAKVTLDTDLGKISIINVEITASVPEISEEEFQKAAIETKDNCMISQLYSCEIVVNASLV